MSLVHPGVPGPPYSNGRESPRLSQAEDVFGPSITLQTSATSARMLQIGCASHHTVPKETIVSSRRPRPPSLMLATVPLIRFV